MQAENMQADNMLLMLPSEKDWVFVQMPAELTDLATALKPIIPNKSKIRRLGFVFF